MPNRLSYFLLMVFILAVAPATAQVPIPANSAPIVDEAQILSSNFEAQLNASIKEVLRQGGPQIGILTLQDISQETIEQVSIRAADQWKLGTAAKDNGVLIVVAVQQRKLRIEVGQGLEGDLTDLESSRIISQIMQPLFKRGDMESGLLLATARIVQVTAPEINVEQVFQGSSQQDYQYRSEKESSPKSKWGTIIFFIIAAFLFIRYPRLFLLALLMGGRGSGRSGGFGGGGGWSGGGGGFSGGGASGGW